MRVLHLYDGHERVLAGEGSVPTVVYELARHTARLGHEVVVVERRWKGLDHHEERDGVLFERFGLSVCPNVSNAATVYSMMKSPFGVLRLIVDRVLFALKARGYLDGFDVVHVHLPFAANVLLALDGSLGKKMVYTAHIGEEKKRFNLDGSAPVPLRLLSPDVRMIKRCSKTVLLNDALRTRLCELGIKPERLAVIPNGVDVQSLTPPSERMHHMREKYGLEGRVVMFSGSITPRKGVDNLLRAARKVAQHHGDVLFLLTGSCEVDREFAQSMRDYVAKSGLEGHVIFAGHVPYEDLKGLYAACDVFVLPSLEEGDPIALKEALASGKPLVGTRVGGIPMQIRDGWNGFLVEPANEEQLAERIEYLIENEGERKRMGKNSRRLAEEEFSWKRIAQRYVRVYEEVIT